MEDKYKDLRGKSKGRIIAGMVGLICTFILGVIFLLISFVGFSEGTFSLLFIFGLLICISLGIGCCIPGFVLTKKYYSYYQETFGKNAQNNVPPSTPQPQPVQPQQTPQPQPVVPKETHIPTPAPVQQTVDEYEDDEDAEKRQVLQTAFTHLIKMRGEEVLKTPPVAKSIMSDLTFNKHKDTVTAFYTMLEEMNNGKSFSDKQSVKKIMKFLENAFKENGTAVPEILLKAKNENGL